MEMKIIKKETIVFILNYAVSPLLIVMCAIVMLLSYFLSSFYASNGLSISTNSSNTTTYNDKEVLINLLDLNNNDTQLKILQIISTLNFGISLLSVVKDRLLMITNNELKTQNNELITEKDNILEQLTNITHAVSVQGENYINNLALPESLTPFDVLNTARTNSTVYEKPYIHNEPIVIE